MKFKKYRILKTKRKSARKAEMMSIHKMIAINRQSAIGEHESTIPSVQIELGETEAPNVRQKEESSELLRMYKSMMPEASSKKLIKASLTDKSESNFDCQKYQIIMDINAPIKANKNFAHPNKSNRKSLFLIFIYL